MDEFIQREEFEELRSKRIALEATLKFRLDLEKTYEKQKIIELDKELDNIRHSNSIAKLRNEGLLKSLQSNMFSNYQKAKISSHSQSVLNREKTRYGDFIAYQIPNLKNEFKVQLMAKQNEIQTVKTLLETQILRNQELCNVEQDFFNNFNKANNSLNEQIKSLTEANYKVEEERKQLLLQQTKIENQTKEKFFNLIQSNVTKETELNNLLQSQLKQQLYDKKQVDQMLENERNQMKKENVELLKKLAESKINNNVTVLKAPPLEEQKIANSPVNNNNLDRVVVKQQIENNKLKEKDLNIIDKIRLERLRQNKEQLKATTTIKQSLQSPTDIVEEKKEFRREITLKKQTIFENNSEKLLENKKTLKENQTKNLDIKGGDKEFELDINIINEEDLSKLVKKEDGDKLDQIVIGNSEGVNEIHDRNNEKANLPSEQLKRKDSLSQLLEEKPTLDKVSLIHKTKIVKRVIAYLDQFSKSKKPGNYIYTTKIINQTSQKIVKDSFYEFLGNDKFDFSTSDPELLISTVGEILFLNCNPNIQLKDFDENEFDSLLDSNIKELFTVLLDHFKRMIKENKTSLPISSNFLTQKLNNFSNSSDFKYKLLPVMEKKLTVAKGVMTMPQGFKSSGFGGFGGNTSNFKTTAIKKSAQTKGETEENLFDNYD